MLKSIAVTINDSKEDFEYGCCATVAIASAFNTKDKYVQLICKAAGYKNCCKGLTYSQIKKIINLIDNRKEWKYKPNTLGLTYYQILGLFPNTSFIVMFSEHLSYAEKGEIYDSYISQLEIDEDKLKWIKGIPKGWWENTPVKKVEWKEIKRMGYMYA